MIIKNLTRKTGTGQLLRYIFRYILDDKKQGQRQEPFIIRHNIRSKDVNGYIQEFKANEARRIHARKDQTAIHHTILSWSDKDKEQVTPEMLKAIAKKYIQLRGESCLYLGTIHTDRHHTHLHIAMSGSQLNGRSSRVSQKEFAQIKIQLDVFQKERYPQLVNSLPAHGKSKLLNTKESSVDRRNGRVSQKEQLLHLVQSAYTNAQSTEAFLNTLRSLNHEPYYRAGNLTGIKVAGRKYRFRTLGIDKEKLIQVATVRNNEAKDLAELHAIRMRSTERKKEANKLNSDVLSRMEEFDNLRISSRGVRGYVPAR